MAKKMTLYDVCNDYSLDSDVSDKGRANAETDEYRWVEITYRGEPIWLGYHKEYDELHYAKSENPNLDGCYV